MAKDDGQPPPEDCSDDDGPYWNTENEEALEMIREEWEGMWPEWDDDDE